MNDTVFALATSAGRSAIAVIRLSGPGVAAAVAALSGSLPRPRKATLRGLRDDGGRLIDRGLVLWFPGPASYTGEDCAELHLHGSSAVIDAVTASLLIHGLRLAEPGEFTRRAFENGKLDLDQAEAVADLIDANSAAQARQAIGQLGGELGRRYLAWRQTLITALADLEAAVDFPDDVSAADAMTRAGDSIAELLAEIDEAMDGAERGRRIREGYRVAVIGAPNAGKSSLFNYLLGRDAAIVTAVEGSTRDIIEAPLVIEGYSVLLADMAGIRPATEAVEVEGVRRAKAWADAADLRLWVVDGSAQDGRWALAAGLLVAGDIAVINKQDIAPGADAAAAETVIRGLGLAVERVSLHCGGGAKIAGALVARVSADLAGAEFPAATRARHKALLVEAREDLVRAKQSLGEPELASENVRRAARALGQVTGRIGTEDVLDMVFASFCIGK